MQEGPKEPGLRPPRSTLRSCVSCRDKENIGNVKVQIFCIGFCILSSEDGRSCHHDSEGRRGECWTDYDRHDQEKLHIELQPYS